MKSKNKFEFIEKVLDSKFPDEVNSREEAMHIMIEAKISENINQINKEELTFGQKVSDKVAAGAGSWKFIIVFMSILAIWIFINVVFLISTWDPYPFILLNLILSCIAALQAPIIMMSQNRQDAKDRIRSENDYKVDLKTELILEDLHKKIDLLLQVLQEQDK